jgi:hypothetical protein
MKKARNCLKRWENQMNAKILLNEDKTLILIIDYPRKKHNKQTSGIMNIKLSDEDYRQLKVLVDKKED